MCCDGNPVWRCITHVYRDVPESMDTRTLKHKVALWVIRTILNFLGSVLSVFLLWLIFFRPYKVRPYVNTAILSAFASTSDMAHHGGMAIQYDLALNVTFFNDHRIYGVRFDHLSASLHYNGSRLGTTDDTLPSFNLTPRRHQTVYPTLHGQADGVGTAVLEELSRQQAQGSLSLDVRVKTTLRYMFWPVRATYYYEYDCWLQFPVQDNSTRPAVTDSIKCQHVAK
ncbi:unnamed protein product [Urochloa decumbens]|uniref:Late embryogenesis abundant protein LEA-2 subgroup domain-containing protein n=1 Tax=Urochloa decumbens TaxID=240449 RepID=A0ABC9AU87_9POAL